MADNKYYTMCMVLNIFIVVAHSIGLYLLVKVNKKRAFNANTVLVGCLSVGELVAAAIAFSCDILFAVSRAPSDGR